jgi:hypothetical protein
MSVDVKISLTSEARWQSAQSLQAQGKITLEEADTYEGPEFLNVKKHKVMSSGAVLILTQDDVEYVYPPHSVARVRTKGLIFVDTEETTDGN